MSMSDMIRAWALNLRMVLSTYEQRVLTLVAQARTATGAERLLIEKELAAIKARAQAVIDRIDGKKPT